VPVIFITCKYLVNCFGNQGHNHVFKVGVQFLGLVHDNERARERKFQGTFVPREILLSGITKGAEGAVAPGRSRQGGAKQPDENIVWNERSRE